MAGTITRSESDSDSCSEYAELFAAFDAVAARYGQSSLPPDDSLDQALDSAAATFDRLLETLDALPDIMQLSRLSVRRANLCSTVGRHGAAERNEWG